MRLTPDPHPFPYPFFDIKRGPKPTRDIYGPKSTPWSFNPK